MLTANVLRRVVQIGWRDSTGTGFTVEHDGRQYLLTAKHVIDGFVGGKLDIFNGSDFVPKNFELVGHSCDKVDIAVLAADRQLSVTFPMPVSGEDIILGQTMYFLGFPYGYANIIKQNGAIPLVKSATFSAFNIDGNLVLDGHNNPGFSGGPVVFIPKGKQTGQFSVAGIITSYPTFEEPVVDEKGQTTDFHININPGIVFASPILEAVKLIEDNSIGFRIQK